VDDNGFTKAQLDNLYFYYSQSEGAEDPVGAIIEIYKRTSNVAKTRLSVCEKSQNLSLILNLMLIFLHLDNPSLTVTRDHYPGTIYVIDVHEVCGKLITNYKIYGALSK